MESQHPLGPSSPDAIFVTRRLGFRFLRIDSLCIVQDDKQDWEEQAPLMWSIYSNATLTLAATRCVDCRDTLLPQLQRTVHGRSATGQPIALAARVQSSFQRPSHIGNDSYLLLSRAWVFQERLISRRALLGMDVRYGMWMLLHEPPATRYQIGEVSRWQGAFGG